MSLTITERAVRGMFYEQLMQQQAASWLEAICTPAFSSDQDDESYAWLGQVPQMSELNGAKKFSQLLQTPWNVKNREYQGGIRIPKKHVLYDKTDQIRMRVTELAARSQSHWWSLIAPLIIAGESTNCYDGQYFFDTDHAEGGSGSQSNDIDADISGYTVATAGTTTAPAPAEMVFAIMDGIHQIVSLKDDQGEYVNENLTDFLIMSGIPLATPAMAALRNRSIDGGDTNILIEQDGFRIRLATTPRLSSWTTKFAIFATGGTQKPFIRQQRRPNQEDVGYDMEGMRYWEEWIDSYHCRMNNECLVNIETERAAAYGDWKKACLVTLV